MIERIEKIIKKKEQNVTNLVTFLYTSIGNPIRKDSIFLKEKDRQSLSLYLNYILNDINKKKGNPNEA